MPAVGVVAVGMAAVVVLLAVLSAGQWGRGPWREEEPGRAAGPDLAPAGGTYKLYQKCSSGHY